MKLVAIKNRMVSINGVEVGEAVDTTVDSKTGEQVLPNGSRDLGGVRGYVLFHKVNGQSVSTSARTLRDLKAKLAA
jgi:hypothetical protein